MRRWYAAEAVRAPLLSALLAAGLAGCAGHSTQRAEVVSATPLAADGRATLDVVQRLQPSQAMLDALDAGIPLRLAYRLRACESASEVMVELRYSALTRRYELRPDSGERRYFVRRSALLAALDRLRLPLGDAAAARCPGSVQVRLDLAVLPLPLRLPALLRPADWRMRSPTATWPGVG